MSPRAVMLVLMALSIAGGILLGMVFYDAVAS